MSAFCVPTPCIIPLRLPTFGDSKSITSETKIEILCETELPNVEVFYTKDGTKPQPYSGIIQGSKTFKYSKPFCLPAGKITVKAIAIHSQFRTMCSNIITKAFYVEHVEKQKKTKNRISHDTTNAAKTDVECSDTVPENIKDEIIETEISISDKSMEQEECVQVIAPTSEDEVQNVLVDESPSPNEVPKVDQCCDEPPLLQPQISIEEHIAPVPNNEPNSSLEIEPDDHVTHLDPVVEEPSTAELENTLQSGPGDIPLQQCLSCNKVSNILAQYCDNCGKKLHKTCTICKERNPGVAKFCQFCGQKFDEQILEKTHEELLKPLQREFQSIGVLAKPAISRKSTCTTTPVVVAQSVQTPQLKVKKSTNSKISATPGQGYWRQQLDYICNHLKVHSNNDLVFQKLIGSPALGKFISADVNETDDKVSIHIVFEVVKSSNCK